MRAVGVAVSHESGGSHLADATSLNGQLRGAEKEENELVWNVSKAIQSARRCCQSMRDTLCRKKGAPVVGNSDG